LALATDRRLENAACFALVLVTYATGNGCVGLRPESQMPAWNGTKLAQN